MSYHVREMLNLLKNHVEKLGGLHGMVDHANARIAGRIFKRMNATLHLAEKELGDMIGSMRISVPNEVYAEETEAVNEAADLLADMLIAVYQGALKYMGDIAAARAFTVSVGRTMQLYFGDQ